LRLLRLLHALLRLLRALLRSRHTACSKDLVLLGNV
jgi:hypothetical protein